MGGLEAELVEGQGGLVLEQLQGTGLQFLLLGAGHAGEGFLRGGALVEDVLVARHQGLEAAFLEVAQAEDEGEVAEGLAFGADLADAVADGLIEATAAAAQCLLDGGLLDDHGGFVAGLDFHALQGDGGRPEAETVVVILLVGAQADAAQAHLYRLATVAALQVDIDFRQLAVHAYVAAVPVRLEVEAGGGDAHAAVVFDIQRGRAQIAGLAAVVADGHLAHQRHFAGGGVEQLLRQRRAFEFEVALRGDRHQLAAAQARDGKGAVFEAIVQQQGVVLGVAFVIRYVDVDLVARGAGQQAAFEAEQGEADIGTGADAHLAQLEVGLVDGIAGGRFDLSAGVESGGPEERQGYGYGERELFHGSILCGGWADVLSAGGWQAAAL